MSSIALSLAHELSRVATSLPSRRTSEILADPDHLIGPRDAALVTGISVPSLKVYRATGRLRAVTPRGKRVLYRVGDLLAYVAKRGAQ